MFKCSYRVNNFGANNSGIDSINKKKGFRTFFLNIAFVRVTTLILKNMSIFLKRLELFLFLLDNLS